METIVITNQKGGDGKSTTAQALAQGLTLRGFKTLLIDLDGQANTTDSLCAVNTGYTTFDILTKSCTAEQAIQHTPTADIIAASPNLSSVDLLLSNKTGKEYRLKETLQGIKAQYDYIIIDTPPTLNTATINALTAADSVIIPCQADIYSIKGLALLFETIQTVKQYCNPALTIKGILLVRYNGRAILSQSIAELLKNTAAEMQTKLFNARIRESIAVRESKAQNKSIFEYAPKSNPAKDYNALIDELLH
ncbi:MAG: AAA family ATPase [Treponemataceae bacterium]|nr:AAA family ATPase [Treponemataceae bacterium]